MIKIIKPGTKKQAVCDNCGAVLSYDTEEDVKYENVKTFAMNCVDGLTLREEYITCPQCKHKIITKAVR